MENRAPRRLEKSDGMRGGVRELPVAVPVALTGCVSSIAILASAPSYVVMPRTHVQLLLRRSLGSSRVDATLNGARTTVLRKAFTSDRAVSLRFSPGAIRQLFAIPASRFVDASVSLTELFGSTAESLVGELSATWDTDLAGLVACIERWILRLPSRGRRDSWHASMAYAASAFDREPGLRVAEVARRLAISERQLRRRFEEAIGMSPKRYAGVARLHRVLDLTSKEPGTAWADVAVLAGYYDQPHMIDDFRTVTGATPKALIAELAGHADHIERG
jgi:AraC-like DNA-binding protein